MLTLSRHGTHPSMFVPQTSLIYVSLLDITIAPTLNPGAGRLQKEGGQRLKFPEKLIIYINYRGSSFFRKWGRVNSC